MQLSASASETCSATLPITTPSSTSQSVFTLSLGIVSASSGPARQEAALAKTIGSFGQGLPVSSACRR